ncbi:MAG: alpha/beta hydrolase [Planctomycetales bacterium]|nr:alpha/beta hydrolase [Planctomycetales bacterium]
MQVELVSVNTADSLRLDGALHRCATVNEGAAPSAVVCLHGVGGNFYASRLQSRLTPSFISRRNSVLWGNTRGRDSVYGASLAGRWTRLGAAYEIVDDCRFDIAAWITWLREEGFAEVGLFGHSLGAVKAIHYAANNPATVPDFIVAASPPRLSYQAYTAADSPGFSEVVREAQRLQSEGRGQQLIEATFPTPMLISAETYVDKYGPGERYNIVRQIDRLTCPTLISYGALELASGNPAFAGLPAALRKAAGDAELHLIEIADADHFYTGTDQHLAAAVSDWLQPRNGNANAAS